ncbi:hypothetical protein KA005_22025 [bacterium]|nr:hypothetical protein [bacterium]
MRYFFFTYRADDSCSRQYAYGNIFIALETFPRNVDMRAIAEKRNPGLTAIITSWQEFKTEEDFNNFREI